MSHPFKDITISENIRMVMDLLSKSEAPIDVALAAVAKLGYDSQKALAEAITDHGGIWISPADQVGALTMVVEDEFSKYFPGPAQVEHDPADVVVELSHSLNTDPVATCALAVMPDPGELIRWGEEVFEISQVVYYPREQGKPAARLLTTLWNRA